METKKVYAAISAVAEEMATQGISKSSRNAQQGFMFRGIDQVYNALAPVLAKHRLVILPRITERTVTERVTQKGGTLFYVVVKAEFDFASAEDGSVHTVVTYGEAMDSGDKATNKAMSIAYKYAAFQAFCIPTEETAIDPDAECHNVAPRSPDEILKDFTAQAADCQASAELDSIYKPAWNALSASKQHQDECVKVYRLRKTELKQAA
ncbi:ERF family protein [Pectobacterium parmentieri]|uniref:ERF family protein n=1 Tax=Pectobacterium parmentieri TaxID=1905730 RepID=UPI000F8DB488|nr:ERF family protein [Pectobacterium parmentieri]AZS56750.1 single-stranded DNA-binding protein [Pectobacterium parmentieri]MBI0431658.1 single-stranded DNA-binding protein [Pectobacterium parmentieri]